MADRGFRIVVAGAVVSGLFMAETLKRAGIDFAVYEKAGEVGGTWRDNTFPGLFVDVLSRQYEFPFQPNYDWSRKYAPATEIWAYIKKVARDRGLTKFIRFNEEIVAARFTEGCWHIETAKGNTDVANVFICATGFLHKPVFPDIPGRESFRRPVIPLGALGSQCAVCRQALGRHRQRRQRCADHRGTGLGGMRRHAVHPPRAMGPYRDNPHSTWRERLKLRLPFAYRREQRRLWQMIIEGDAWRLKPGPQREAMEREYTSFLDYIRDPELKKELTPDYNLGCTRIPKSDKNYYAAVHPQRAHRQGRDRHDRAGRRRHGGRDAGRSRRPGLCHRL